MAILSVVVPIDSLAEKASPATAGHLASLTTDGDPADSGIVATVVSGHLVNTNNPHSVTAVQVGAYTTGQVDALIAGASSSTLAAVLAAGNTDGGHGATFSGTLAAGNGKAFFNAAGSLRIDGANGEYPIEVRDAAGAAYVFRVINGSGECQSKGEFSSDAGFRITTFGAYCGVQNFTRWTFNNHYIAARSARVLIDTGEAAVDDGTSALQVTGAARATGVVVAAGFTCGAAVGLGTSLTVTTTFGDRTLTFTGGLLTGIA